MERVALIYNPASGQYSARRAATVQRVIAVLHEAGIEAEALETDAPGSARSLAKAAMRSGYDTIIACGGDGGIIRGCFDGREGPVYIYILRYAVKIP